MAGNKLLPDDATPPPVEGRYANGFQVGHNAFEFVLDFQQEYADAPGARTLTRVVTSPAYAKAFLEILAASVARYEKEFGTIVTPHSDGDHG
jgi:hypothetical protein